ncbi:MAG TPA: OsmC family peroxiredoxin [Steroidobacteraceae bacterium]|nr:OsmC family peroxiredoxin [Steroidobacteraceae bacterium]
MGSVIRFDRRNGPAEDRISRSMVGRAHAVWRGTARAGTGAIAVAAAPASERFYSFAPSVASGGGTNPGELLAAAHASSFLMNLAAGLQAAGYTPSELSAEAVVTLEPDGPGVRIGRSALRLRAKVPGLARRAFEALAGYAQRTCPVSKALNAQITLDARLTGECQA